MIKNSILSKLQNINFNKNEYTADCPFCGKPGNRKKFSFSPEKGERSKSGIFHCFSCGAKGTGWQLARYLGVILEKTYNPIKLENFIPSTIQANNKIFNVIKNFSRFSHSIDIQNERAYVPEKMVYETCDPNTGKVFLFKTVDKTNEKKKVFSGHYLEGQPVYGLPENIIKYPFNLHKAKNAKINYIVEGEPCAAVLSAFLPVEQVAIGTHSHSNMSNMPIEAIKHLLKKQIYIIPDADKVGLQAAATLCQRLIGYGIDSQIIELPDANKKGYDVKDFLETKSISDFFYLVSKSTETLTKNFIKKYLPENYKKIEKFNSHYVSEILTPEMIDRRHEKCTIIQSAQGTGKTEHFADISQYAKKNAKEIICLTHRIALGGQIAERLNRVFYKSEEAEICGINGKLKKGSIVCSADSAPKITLPENYFLLIDEIDQFLDHLVRSKTLSGSRRIESISALESLVKNAEKIIISSADIPEYVIELFKGMNIEIVVFKNEYQAKDKCFTIYEKGAELMNDIEKSIYENNKIWMAFSSKNKLKKTTRLLKKKFPLLKILEIHSGNSQTEEIQSYIKKPELLKNYDAVFFSPSIFTGADFNITNFSKGFLFIDGTDTPASEILQAANRFRQTSIIAVYIKNNKGRRDTDPEKIKSNLLNYKLNSEGNYTSINIETLERQIEKTIFFDAYVKIEAQRNESINFLRSNFYNLLKQRQYKIIINDKEDCRTEAEKEADAELKKKIKAEICKEIKTAPIISEDEADRIDNGKAENEADEMKLHKAKLIKLNGGHEDIDFIIDEFEDKKPEIIASKIENLERMEPEATLQNQLDEKKDNVFLPDRQLLSKREKLCKEIDGYLCGLLDQNKKLEAENKIFERTKKIETEKNNIQAMKNNYFYEKYFLPTEIKNIEKRKINFYKKIEFLSGTGEEIKEKIEKREKLYKKQIENIQKGTKPMIKKSEKYMDELLKKLTINLNSREKQAVEVGYIGGIITDKNRENIFSFIKENGEKIKTLLKININSVLETDNEEEKNAEIGYFIRSFYGLFLLKTRRIDREGNRQICIKRMMVIKKIRKNRKTEASVTHDVFNKKQNLDVLPVLNFFEKVTAYKEENVDKVNILQRKLNTLINPNIYGENL